MNGMQHRFLVGWVVPLVVLGLVPTAYVLTSDVGWLEHLVAVAGGLVSVAGVVHYVRVRRR